mgnify:CR=1 FL=1
MDLHLNQNEPLVLMLDVHIDHTFVFFDHQIILHKLQKLLLDEDCFLPSKKRDVSDICLNADLNISNNVIRNGQDRAHRIYKTDEKNYSYKALCGEKIVYCFDSSYVSSV